MLTWEERIEIIKDACDVKNNRQLEEVLGLSNGYINDLLKGKNKNPAKITAALITVLKVNPVWFYDETAGIFGETANKKQQMDMTIRENLRFMDAFDEHVINVIKRNGLTDLTNSIEERLTRIEERLDRENPPGGRGGYEAAKSGDGGGFTGEPEPEYGEEEERVRIPYVEDIAAGPPIAQSEDQAGQASVPARLIRKGFRYYTASIRGASMAEAGIRDGDLVLIRHTDVPADGAIQVVRYQGKSTLKRMREIEGKGWELHYEDGSGRVIPANSASFQIQGEFVAILPGTAVPEGPPKGRQRHEKPLENC